MTYCIMEKAVVAVLPVKSTGEAFRNIVEGFVCVGKSCCHAVFKCTCTYFTETGIVVKYTKIVCVLNVLISESGEIAFF